MIGKHPIVDKPVCQNSIEKSVFSGLSCSFTTKIQTKRIPPARKHACDLQMFSFKVWICPQISICNSVCHYSKQMFGSVAPILDPSEDRSAMDVNKVDPQALFSLLLALETECPDYLDILELVDGEKPLMALVRCNFAKSKSASICVICDKVTSQKLTSGRQGGSLNKQLIDISVWAALSFRPQFSNVGLMTFSWQPLCACLILPYGLLSACRISATLMIQTHSQWWRRLTCASQW